MLDYLDFDGTVLVLPVEVLFYSDLTDRGIRMAGIRELTDVELVRARRMKFLIAEVL